MKSFFLFILTVLFFSSTYGQTSFLQDKSGQTSLQFGGGTSVSLNAADANASFGYGYQKTPAGSFPPFFLGGNAQLASTTGTAAIFDGTTFKPSISLTLNFGIFIHTQGRSGRTEFIYTGIKFTDAQNSILKADTTNTFDTRKFIGPVFTVGYNIRNKFFTEKAGLYIFGVSANFGKINDLGDLKPAKTYTSTSATKNDTVTVAQQNETDGFTGVYKESFALTINMDAYFYPKFAPFQSQVGIGFYTRSQLSGYNPRNSVGTGLIFGQKAAPGNTAFGIMYQFNDVFNQLGKQNDFWKRGGINLVAGYKF